MLGGMVLVQEGRPLLQGCGWDKRSDRLCDPRLCTGVWLMPQEEA